MRSMLYVVFLNTFAPFVSGMVEPGENAGTFFKGMQKNLTPVSIYPILSKK